MANEPKRIGHSCSYHILTSFVIYTEQAQGEINLFILNNVLKEG